MTPRARWLILALALGGLAFASASSYVHYRLFTDPTYVSPCDINATFNCTEAYLSRFGSVYKIPVAIGGVAWFALVALIAAFATPDKPGVPPKSPAGGYIFGLATVALAAILYLGYASWFVLHTYCLLCIGTYVAVIGIFITSGVTATTSVITLPGRLASDLRAAFGKRLALVAALLYVVATASCVVLFPREMQMSTAVPPPPPVSEQERFEQLWDQQPRVDLGILRGEAKVVIVKFNDWLCPGCKASALAYEPVFEKYAKSEPGVVKVVIKDWPWNAECNFSGGSLPGHEGSCTAAAAVRLARDLGKEKPMIDWLLSSQEQLFELGRSGAGAQASQMIRQKAEDMLGVKDFDREYPVKMTEVKRDVADGAALGVRSTPTFFINGVKLDQILPPEYLDLAIQIEMKKAGGKQ